MTKIRKRYESKENLYKHKKLFFHAVIFGLVVIGLSIIITNIVTSESGAPPPGPGDSDGGGPYYSTGDWVIQGDDNITRSNQTINLKGNLTIQDSGKLTFRNVTLKLDCSKDGEFGIVVENGGGFYILDSDNNPETINDRSNVTANNTESEFKFLVNSSAEFVMKNSELSECGYKTRDDERAGLTIKTNNTIIDNSSFINNYRSIFLYSSSNNRITNNDVSNNKYGIYLYRLRNSLITNNRIFSNNDYGICIIESSNIKMRDNIIDGNKYNFCVSGSISDYYNDIDSSNTANGKPIIYIIEKHNFTIDEKTNGSYFGLISCSNIIIRNISLSNNGQGVLFVNTTNSLIENCEVSNNNCGIKLYKSNNNQIINNSASNNKYGIHLESSSNNTISNNNAFNNNYGIHLYELSNSLIANNSLNSNNNYGIHLESSSNNTISNNNISNHDYGILLDSSSDCKKSSFVTILNNTFRNCGHAIIGRGVEVPDDPSNKFINVFCDITQYWYIKIKPINEKGEPIYEYHKNWGIVNLTSKTYYMFSLGLEYRQYMKLDENDKIYDELKDAFRDNGESLSNKTFIVEIDDKNWVIVDFVMFIPGIKEYKIEDTGTELKIYWQGINYTHRVVNGIANFELILVKEGSMDHNPFTIGAGVHVDYDEKIAWRPPFNGTPHLRHIEYNFSITQNYWENPKEIVIPNALAPDFSIRTFSCKLSYMELGKTNELNVRIRNMGEAPNKASIKFSGKLDTEDNYTEIDTIEEEIPAKTTYPHHKVNFNWIPTEAGNYEIIVEVKPLDGTDPFPFDDNSPMNVSNIHILHYPKIEIETPEEGSTKRGMIDVTGTFEGRSDWIHVWMWGYVFSLDLNYKQYLKNGKICEELNNTFKNNNCLLSNMTYINKKDNQTWEIVDWTNWYRGKIVITTTELQIYLGKFSKPYEYDDKNHKWYCKLDSGPYNGKNQIIYANISVEGGLYFDEDEITISLTNEPDVNTYNPNNYEILTAGIENDKIYVWGYAWKVTPRASEIKDVELIIDGKKRNIILEKKNETYWKWHFEWNIASKEDPVKDGKYKILVQSKDYELKESEIDEITIYIDNQARYSMITVPKIIITTKEPIEPIKDEVLIRGTVEDDLVVKNIWKKVDDGNWEPIFKKDIDKDKYNWEFLWDVRNLENGIHTIYFRVVDEETDEYVIEVYYPVLPFNITKHILPDLTIENVIIKKNGTKTTNAKNGENLTFEITIKIHNADTIIQPTTIYIELSEGEKSFGMINKIIDKTITDNFTVTIPWIVYGMKGTHNYTIELDKRNYINEENEDNNVKTVTIEILDSPSEDIADEDDSSIPNIGKIILIIAILSVVIMTCFLSIYNKKVKITKKEL